MRRHNFLSSGLPREHQGDGFEDRRDGHAPRERWRQGVEGGMSSEWQDARKARKRRITKKGTKDRRIIAVEPIFDYDHELKSFTKPTAFERAYHATKGWRTRTV
jgi:hypothetical protein